MALTLQLPDGRRAELRAWRWHAADPVLARALNAALGPDGGDALVLDPPIGMDDHEAARGRRAVEIFGGRIIASTPVAAAPDDAGPVVV